MRYLKVSQVKKFLEDNFPSTSEYHEDFLESVSEGDRTKYTDGAYYSVQNDYNEWLRTTQKLRVRPRVSKAQVVEEEDVTESDI